MKVCEIRYTNKLQGQNVKRVVLKNNLYYCALETRKFLYFQPRKATLFRFILTT